jgi:serine/threonine protein kinase
MNTKRVTPRQAVAKASVRDLDVTGYQFLARIGEGRSGEVGAFFNTLVGGYHAVKAVARDVEADEMAGLRHLSALSINSFEHLVQVKHAGYDGSGKRFHVVMPLAEDLRGGPVTVWSSGYRPKNLRLYRERLGPLQLREALDITNQALLGASCLHERGLAHCDIKPSNILCLDGKWRVGDFGSVAAEAAGARQRGTEGFLAPEGVASRQADVYALGKVLHGLTTGAARCHDPAYAEHAADLTRLLEGACAADPADRYSPEEFERGVRDFLFRLGDGLRWDLVLPYDFHTMTAEERQTLRGLLAYVRRRTTPRSVEELPGSVILRLELTRAEAEYLRAAFEAGELAQFGVCAAREAPQTPAPVQPQRGARETAFRGSRAQPAILPKHPEARIATPEVVPVERLTCQDLDAIKDRQRQVAHRRQELAARGEVDSAGRQPAGKGTPRMAEVLSAVEQMLRGALRKGRPTGVEWEVIDLYRNADDSRGKTESLLAACLEGWEEFVGALDALPQERPLSLDEVAALLIHRAYLRKRREDYWDRHMSEQVDRANVRGPDGELLPFDPPAPGGGEDALKQLEELIANLLEGRSVRERMVLDLYLNGHTYAAIVEKVKESLPGEPISQPTVSRIVERFRDELRSRLEG